MFRRLQEKAALDLTRFQNLARELFAKLADWFSSPQFYFQAAAIAVAVFIAFGLAGQVRAQGCCFPQGAG